MLDRLVMCLMLVPLYPLTFSGCQYVRPTLNSPLVHHDPSYGYRLKTLTEPTTNTDEMFVVAAFSGGGLRASAFALGALREMAAHRLTWRGIEKRFLDELDYVSAVSGGTYTAGYYALFGDRLFRDFETRFLQKDWGHELWSRILWSPGNWIRLWSPYFGRAHILADLLDEALFEGHRYATLVNKKRRPFIAFNASDMATLARFTFIQPYFDWICSDLSQVSLAHAAAASSALPLVLSPMSFKNYAGHCGFQPAPLAVEEQTSNQSWFAKALLSYLDSDKRPYIHVVDGSLTDNIGVRTFLETIVLMGGLEKLLETQGVQNVKKLVFVIVNAETSPDPLTLSREDAPLIIEEMRAVIDIPINRYTEDSYLLLRLAVDRWRNELRANPPDGQGALAPDVDIYLIDVTLNDLPDGEERSYFMRIPTALSLPGEAVERLQSAAGRLMRESKEFQRFLRDVAREDGAVR